MAKKTKEQYLEEMKDMGWTASVDLNSSYEEIKDEFDTASDEMSDDYSMFPNGRDYDAENEGSY